MYKDINKITDSLSSSIINSSIVGRQVTYCTITWN